MEQVHRANIAFVDTLPTAPISDVDALITTQTNIALAVKHADCLPILIYHPRGVVAAVHAGRRSTNQQILKKVLRYCKSQLALKGPIYLWFGPALCSSCHSTNPEKTTHFNLQKENRLQAEQVFSPENLLINYSSFCTAHHNDQFYSYRADGPGVPMNWSAITLA